MKSRRRIKIIGGISLGVVLLFFCLPTYLRNALIYLNPDMTDASIFASHLLKKTEQGWDFPLANKFNAYQMNSEENAYLDKYETVAYLVIQKDSVLYEEYRDGWKTEKLVNVFSVTKSIVGLLVGIAFDEGAIESLDDPISKYLPEFSEGTKITVRNLLTMSSGLNWDESYSSPFSTTAQAYYGDNIRELIMGLKLVEEPGKKYSYKSGDTQLLSFVVEAALKKKYSREITISDYAADKLWQPIEAAHDALWSLDRRGGDEKTYCCFNTTARDIARLARLVLRNGDWNGKQVISQAYLKEAIAPASYLQNEFGDGALNYYGFQIWNIHYQGMEFPAFKGLGGQYIFAIPQKEAIVVRLGHQRSDEYIRENTVDMEEYLNIAFRILK
jgi:CubicO group peptidase (beta-lactamase class C family)